MWIENISVSFLLLVDSLLYCIFMLHMSLFFTSKMYICAWSTHLFSPFLSSSDMFNFSFFSIVTAFTIEPYSPSFGPTSPNLIVKQPIRGIMTTYGYALPDPSHDDGDRLSVWFSGGKMECGERRDSIKFQVWKEIFGSNNTTTASCTTSKQPPRPRQRKRRTFTQGMMVYAAKLLMGATGYNDDMDEETGIMKYKFEKPMGGHGKAFVDILHLDDCNR